MDKHRPSAMHYFLHTDEVLSCGVCGRFHNNEGRLQSAIVYTNSVRFQWLCPGDPLQIEVKEHINANIMA